MKFKNFSLKRALLFGFVFYISFSFALLWNYIEWITKIVMLLDFAFIGLLYFSISKYNSSKKEYYKLLTYPILIGILYISLKLLFTYFHEANHAFTVFLYREELIEIKFLRLGLGYTRYHEIESSLIESHVVISGSLGNVIILNIILFVTIAYRKDLKLEIYLPHYFIFGVFMYEEISYWRTSILNGYGDGWFFLELNTNFDLQITLFAINCILLIEMLLISLFFVYELYTQSIRKKENLQ